MERSDKGQSAGTGAKVEASAAAKTDAPSQKSDEKKVEKKKDKDLDDLPPLESDEDLEEQVQRMKRQQDQLQQLGPDPMIEELRAHRGFDEVWGEGTTKGGALGEFNLVIYTIPQEVLGTSSIGTLDSIFDLLDSKGKTAGDAIGFKAGTTTLFFKVIRDTTGVDLMALVGSTVEQNTDEEDLCCGILPTELAVAAVDRLKPVIEGDAKLTDRVKALAKTLGLDEEWFVKSIASLSAALRSALVEVTTANAVIVGLYE